jgi:hypothetical protein
MTAVTWEPGRLRATEKEGGNPTGNGTVAGPIRGGCGDMPQGEILTVGHGWVWCSEPMAGELKREGGHGR